MKTNEFLRSMEIGSKFAPFKDKLYDLDIEWHGTEECAEFARRVYKKVDTELVYDCLNDNEWIDVGMDEVFPEMIAEYKQYGKIFSHRTEDYDDFARGFICGEVFGEYPYLAGLAEEEWDRPNNKYAYYQDVVNEINSSEEAYQYKRKRFLIQIRMYDGFESRRLAYANEIVKLTNEMDYNGITDLLVYDVSKFDQIRKLDYVGWQPMCLIEYKDEDGHVVISGYGEDH